jgi:predicted dinucleotide-binding enzyme
MVIDIMNPVEFSRFMGGPPGAGSAVEEILGKAPGARAVKAFNTTVAGTLVDDGGRRAIYTGALAHRKELELLRRLLLAV